MATGVLLGIGRATKLLTFLVGCDKAYAATIRLGATTVTSTMPCGEVVTTTAVGKSPAGLRDAIAGPTGAIDRVPSAVSAIKIKGERAYARVRAVRTSPGRASGHRRALRCLGRAAGHGGTVCRCSTWTSEVEVSSGTYVRALARDLGAPASGAPDLPRRAPAGPS